MIEQISTIYDTQRENEFITQHMNDGLIIISSGRHIISANMAAKKYLILIMSAVITER